MGCSSMGQQNESPVVKFNLCAAWTVLRSNCMTAVPAVISQLCSITMLAIVDVQNKQRLIYAIIEHTDSKTYCE
jgi:hypothetical protein